MDESEQLLKQLMLGISPEARHWMQRFIRLVAERDLAIIRRIESGPLCQHSCRQLMR
jgi:hypothetical protein